GCSWACPRPAQSRAAIAPLAAIRGSIVGTRAVVGRFLRNDDVMRMALLHRRRAHLDEASAGPQFLNVPGAAIAHARSQPADKLVDERRQVPLVRHSPLDAFGHQLAAGAEVLLAVAVARTLTHGADRAHAAIGLEAAALEQDGLPGALR